MDHDPLDKAVAWIRTELAASAAKRRALDIVLALGAQGVHVWLAQDFGTGTHDARLSHPAFPTAIGVVREMDRYDRPQLPDHALRMACESLRDMLAELPLAAQQSIPRDEILRTLREILAAYP